MPILVEATFERILNGRNYLVFDNQLIFFSQKLDTYVITQISADQTYTADDLAQLPANAPVKLIKGKLVITAE